MSRPWYYQNDLLNDRHGELLAEARAHRLINESRGGSTRSARLLAWLGARVVAFVRQRGSLAAPKPAYREEQCATC